MIKKIKYKILSWLVNLIFKPVTSTKFLVQKKDGIYFGAEKLNDDQVKNVAKEAKMIRDSWLFKSVVQEMNLAGQKKIFEQSTNFDDVMYGKMVLWTVDVLQKKFDHLSHLG